MLNTIKNNKKTIIFIVLILLLIVGGIFMFGDHYVNIRKQHLNEYQYSTGGGMNGGYYHKTVKRYNDTLALISIENAEWHNQDPTVNEYLVNVSILDDLETIIRKYHMNFWNRKTFSNMFIADGESYSYSFEFDEKDIYFSAQHYPTSYSNKLSKLNEIINKYLEKAEKLPGLVNSNTDDECYELPENEILIYVSRYCKDRLYLKIMNGTDEEFDMPATYVLKNTDTNRIIQEDKIEYPRSVYSRSQNETSLSLNERLEKGNYKIIIGDIEIAFEIK